MIVRILLESNKLKGLFFSFMICYTFIIFILFSFLFLAGIPQSLLAIVVFMCMRVKAEKSLTMKRRSAYEWLTVVLWNWFCIIHKIFTYTRSAPNVPLTTYSICHTPENMNKKEIKSIILLTCNWYCCCSKLYIFLSADSIDLCVEAHYHPVKILMNVWPKYKVLLSFHPCTSHVWQQEIGALWSWAFSSIHPFQ